MKEREEKGRETWWSVPAKKREREREREQRQRKGEEEGETARVIVPMKAREHALIYSPVQMDQLMERITAP